MSHAPEIAIEGHTAVSKNLTSKILAEIRVTKEYCYHMIHKAGIRTLGNPRIPNPNKLIVLEIAASLGLSVPETYVSNQLPAEVGSAPEKFITKSMSDGIFLWDYDIGHKGYFTYTEEISTVHLRDSLQETLTPSLIQKKIDKEFEIRSFYLDGKFYSCAIISQNDKQTSVDYRKYNFQNQNRNIPIKLPEDISIKLKKLFSILDLNTGSVDLIVDKRGEYYFLEINPSGQWGRMSDVCNYGLDEIIANWLMGRNA